MPTKSKDSSTRGKWQIYDHNFFEHRDCPEAIRPQLQQILEDLITEGADSFYVGDQGRRCTVRRTGRKQDKWVIQI